MDEQDERREHHARRRERGGEVERAYGCERAVGEAAQRDEEPGRAAELRAKVGDPRVRDHRSEHERAERELERRGVAVALGEEPASDDP